MNEKFIFTPQWTAHAQFAGYYVAQEKGFYKQAGLDVEIVHPSVSQTAMNRLKNRESQATTLQLCQALEIVDNDIPLVNILQTSMNNATVIVSRRDKDPLKQVGARVGMWQAGFSQIAMCMSNREHLNYQWVRFTSNMDLFLKGAIDGTLAMSYNEYYQLLQMGFTFTENNVYRVTTGCLADNKGSERVMQKNGMIKEAEHLDYEWHDGKMKTRLEYRLLRHEWEEKTYG